MSESALMIPCLNCAAMNRVPQARLGDAPICGRCQQALFAGKPANLEDGDFERKALRGDLPVLVDFWAPWCGPCLNMAPHFAEAAKTLEPGVRLAKVDTEAQQALGARFQIRSIPTMILFSGGREVARQSGSMSAGQIVQWTRQQLPSR